MASRSSGAAAVRTSVVGDEFRERLKLAWDD